MMRIGHSSERIRPAAVAGMFYPGSAEELARTVDAMLRAVAPADDAPVPKALIVPHAGHVYSGPIAASAYARLIPGRGRITRAVLLGPAHRVWFEGLALPDADALETPLGPVRVDLDGARRAASLPGVIDERRAHAGEHSLEVQLPFLQRALGDVAIVPLVVGEASAEQVARVLDALWGGDETVILISSDLSHYLGYEDARAADSVTARRIRDLHPLDHEQACGATPVDGLLVAARRRHLRVEQLDLRNSGDTAGDRDRVVGYGSFAFHEAAS